ncbi:hypothetical protein PAMP_016856 [Pampus punctatissimus]
MVVKEDSDAILLCSLSTTSIKKDLFDWKKDGQKEVFMYDKGDHYNNGRTGQDEQFKGRVSHFPEQLEFGNASIIIRNTKVTDSGKYTCDFPFHQPKRRAHIELIVGAAPKPIIVTLDQTKDWALLRCEVRGASPEPEVEWQDSAGNILPGEKQVSEQGGRFYITLQTTVTKTDRYRCVSTQKTIYHQIYTETFVRLDDGTDQNKTGQVVRVPVEEGGDAILPCSLSTKENIEKMVFDWKKDGQTEVFFYEAGKHYNNGRAGQDEQFKGRVFHFENELKSGNASIKILNTKMADNGSYTCNFPGRQISSIILFVGAAPEPSVTSLDQTNDWALLQCKVRGVFPKPELHWKDGAGNILPAETPQVTERGGRYDIILNITVKKTDTYHCVSTQKEINHQTDAEIYVHISGSSTGLVVVAVLCTFFGTLLVVGVFHGVKHFISQKQNKTESLIKTLKPK